MELTRISVSEPRHLVVPFSGGLCVVDHLTPVELASVSQALRSIMGGVLPDGVAIWTEIDGVEFELDAELVRHIGVAVGPVGVVDPVSLDQEPTPTAVAIRSALELLGVLPPTLTHEALDQALEKTRQRHEAEIRQARALAERAETDAAAARSAATETEIYYRTKVEAEERRFLRRKSRFEVLVAEATRANQTAQTLTNEKADQHLQLVAELGRVIDKSSASAEIRRIVAADYCLNLRKHILGGTSELVAADQRALCTAIDVLRPLDDRRVSKDPVSDAALWLLHTEQRSSEEALIALFGQRAQPHKTLGLIPVVIDGTQSPTSLGFSRLPELVAEVTDDLQIIHLGPLDARTKAMA